MWTFYDPICFFNESICFFGLRPIENWFFNEVFVFWVWGILKIIFFNEGVCFFGLRPIENGFFNDFFCFRHCGRRCCALFSYEFKVFLKPELFFQWESLFCAFRPVENGFFNESLCFFGLRPIENLYFNEGVCFFGLRHCGRRCCALFWFEFVDFIGPEVFFQWESLFFWSQAYWKWIFQWECLFFWSQALWKTVLSPFFMWICRIFKTRIAFSMKVFVFLVWGILKIDFPAVGNMLVLVGAFSN